MSESIQRAVPLATIAAMGVFMRKYLKQSGRDPSQWKIREGAVMNGCSAAVLMSTQSLAAFRRFFVEPLSVANKQGAPVKSSGIFPVEAVVQRGFRAPKYGDGRRAASFGWRSNVYGEIVVSKHG